MDKFFKQYKDIKRQNKDINVLSSTQIYKELKMSIDNIDCDKIFNIQDNVQFANNIKIGYSKVYEEEGINMGIFYVSKFNLLPLHDHPDMYVFSKPLYGKAKKTFFSLCDEKDRRMQFDYPINYWLNEKFDPSKEVTVKAQISEMHLVQKGDETQVIEPNKNNLHEIVAVENFAFLDVLIPDYDMMNARRFCNYYDAKKILDINKNIIELKIKAVLEDYDIQEVQSPLINEKFN